MSLCSIVGRVKSMLYQTFSTRDKIYFILFAVALWVLVMIWDQVIEVRETMSTLQKQYYYLYWHEEYKKEAEIHGSDE